jgi:hypothetical protein
MSQAAQDINAAHQRYRESLELGEEARLAAHENLLRVVDRVRREANGKKRRTA